jgi:hypothetical protein
VSPSIHEIPLVLLDERPAMLLALVRAAGGPTLDADEVVPERDSFAELAPHAADRVLLVRHAGRVVAALVVELQRRADPATHASWPLHLASVHARLGVPTWLVVLTLDVGVARWAARPIATFHGGVLAPLVIGPRQIPRDIDGGSLELMVLATMTHGQGALGGLLAVRTLSELRTAAEVDHLDGARMRLYTDLVLASIDEIARSYVEAMMIDIRNWEPQSEFAKHWKAEGRTEGRVEGLRAGRIEALRAVCELLGIGWTAAHDDRVQGASAAELATLLADVRRERRWPE